jgi:hypothetical protein
MSPERMIKRIVRENLSLFCRRSWKSSGAARRREAGSRRREAFTV